MAVAVAYSAVGHRPASHRGSVEGWLSRGGLAQVAALLPGWTHGATLPAAVFHAEFFGAGGRTDLATHAQAVGTALGDGTAEGQRKAGASFAGLMKAATPSGLDRVMATAVAAAADTPVQAKSISAGGGHKTASSPKPPVPPTEKAQRDAAALRQRNIENLARVIYTEARGNGPDAMTAIGHTIRNRMTRNAEAEVDRVWGGYRHGARPPSSDTIEMAVYEQAKRIAAGILDGTIPDPTGGATQYYSPQGRTTKILPPTGQPNSEGFETIPRVMDLNSRRPGQNTYPDWSRSSDFERIPMPNIPESSFRFYRQTENGRVR